MVSSGAFGSSGLPAAPSGRPAAHAAHRAALRDVDVDIAVVDSGGGESRCGQECVCSAIHCTGIDAIGVSLLYGEKTYCCYAAIGDFESFEDSPLRGNIAAVVCEAQCKDLTIGHSFGLGHFPGEEGKKRSSAISASAMQPQTMRLGFIRLLYVGGAATEEP